MVSQIRGATVALFQGEYVRLCKLTGNHLVKNLRLSKRRWTQSRNAVVTSAAKKNGITTMLMDYYKRIIQIVFMTCFLLLQVCIEKCRVENELEHKTFHS